MEFSLQKVSAELLNHDKIMILSHADPDGDTIGSAFGLYLALKQLNKKVKILCNNDFHEKYNYITCLYTNDEFDEEFIVSVDVADIKLLGDNEKIKTIKNNVDLAIDHHLSHREFAKNHYVDSSSGACAMIIYQIITKIGADITKDIANALYTGVATDTGCFKYSNTGVSGHLIAAELIKKGADYDKINREMFETKSFSRLKLEKSALDSLELFLDKKCAIITITQKMLKETNTTENDLDGIVSIPRQIKGVEVGISIREKENEFENKDYKTKFKISLRTNQEVDAAEVCSHFDGGGHKRAAGCVIEGNEKEVKEKLISVLKKYI